MTNKAVSWAIKQPLEDSLDKLLLIVLSELAESDGYIPPIEQLTEFLSCRQMALRRSLDRLERSGYIRVVRYGGLYMQDAVLLS